MADFLEDIITREFNAEIDDGSYNDVARNICRLYKVIATSAEAQVLSELSKLPKCDLSQCQTNSNDDSDDDEMEMDDVEEGIDQMSTKSKPRNEPDEDGWVTVPSRRKN